MRDTSVNLKLTKAQQKVLMGRVAGNIPMPRAPLMSTGPMGDTAMPPFNPQEQAMMMPSEKNIQGSSMVGEDPLAALRGLGAGDMLQQRQAMPELSVVDQQIQYSLIADQLWKDSGGSDSIAASLWGKFQKGSGSKHLDSPRDYFVSAFIKWKMDPEKYSKGHPREASLLKRLNDEFEASQTPEEGMPIASGGM